MTKRSGRELDRQREPTLEHLEGGRAGGGLSYTTGVRADVGGSGGGACWRRADASGVMTEWTAGLQEGGLVNTPERGGATTLQGHNIAEIAAPPLPLRL